MQCLCRSTEFIKFYLSDEYFKKREPQISLFTETKKNKFQINLTDKKIKSHPPKPNINSIISLNEHFKDFLHQFHQSKFILIDPSLLFNKMCSL